MAKDKNDRTNAMRILDAKGAKYTPLKIDIQEAVDAVTAAKMLGMEPERVFKTLVTVGRSGEHYVFVVPGPHELDLRAAARAVGEKSVEMIKSKELLPLTGYIHGGCSPVGMKKQFTTVIDSSAENFAAISVSAGKIGCQMEISLGELAKALPFTLAEVRTA